MIARAIQPETQHGKKIVNIVTQLKEIGAGTNSEFAVSAQRDIIIHFLNQTPTFAALI